jgi:uncharacterized protein (UPF0210 family)
MEEVILFTVVGSPTMVAKSIEEDDEAVYMEYPFILYREGGMVIASPYMPLADQGVVAFKKNNIVATSIASKYIVKNYQQLVKELKQMKFSFKEELKDDTAVVTKPTKILH